MLKKLMIVVTTCFLLSISPLVCSAGPAGRDFAFGWQFSRPATGFSLKIPYQKDFFLQPILAVSLNKNDTFTTSHCALGLRGIYNLPKRQDFLPYAGVSLGYSQDYKRTADSSDANGNTAFEAFFGVEYQRYLLRPSLEIGIGGLRKTNGSFYAGVIYNVSVMYYF